MKQKLSTFALLLSALAVGLLALAACNVSAAPSQSLEPAGQSESASEPLPQMAQGEAAFTGVVEAIELDTYTVGGAIFKIDADSQRPADLTVGAAVQIRAHVDPDGSFYAQIISPAPAASGGSGLRFEFEGTVQSISGDTAIISGQPVQLSPALASGLQVGDTVRVQGTLNAGVFRAQEVERSDDDGTHTPEPTELHEASETPEPTEEREATHTPEATERHEATRTPEATERHEATRTPEPTERHEATRTPEPTERREATHTPEPTEEREATHTPEPTEEREATRTPEPTEAREATRTPEPTEVHEATRTPESTEVREATHTPEPTEVHEATRTPEPTEVHEATHTPEPTEVHEATHTPEPND